MSNHSRTNSYNHRTTDASTTNHHATSSEIFVIDTERILVTIAPYGWRTYIRREQPNEYAVCYENAAGVISDSLALDRREARRLIAEKCRAAVWIDLRDQTEWPDDNRAVNGGDPTMIAGKTGHWCPSCQEFREPVTPEGRA